MKTIDINADLGEGGPDDDLLIPLLSSANIACGGHAGDEMIMRRTILACIAADVAIGAHPGYEDRENFGRVARDQSSKQTSESIQHQITRFLRIIGECGAIPHHVKPHGALYNQANTNAELAAAFVKPIAVLMPGTMVYCPPSGELARATAHAGLRPVAEGFADRRYEMDGSLMPRTQAGAVLHDAVKAVEQSLRVCIHGEVVTSTGTIKPLHIHTLCVHGDGAKALSMLRAIRAELESNGFAIKAPV